MTLVLWGTGTSQSPEAVFVCRIASATGLMGAVVGVV